jgi:hypothetical protein
MNYRVFPLVFGVYDLGLEVEGLGVNGLAVWA